jgi:hypothetical protein
MLCREQEFALLVYFPQGVALGYFMLGFQPVQLRSNCFVQNDHFALLVALGKLKLFSRWSNER